MEYSCKGDKEQAILTARKLVLEALERRKIELYRLEEIGVDALGEDGVVTTTLAAIALM